MINLKLKIPEKISSNSTYAGIHWAKRKKIADIWHKSFLQFKNKYKVEEYPVGITFIFRLKKQIDIDNLGTMIKLSIDGLKYAKIIEDDTPKHINELHIFQEKGNDEVEIILI